MQSLTYSEHLNEALRGKAGGTIKSDLVELNVFGVVRVAVIDIPWRIGWLVFMVGEVNFMWRSWNSMDSVEGCIFIHVALGTEIDKGMRCQFGIHVSNGWKFGKVKSYRGRLVSGLVKSVMVGMCGRSMILEHFEVFLTRSMYLVYGCRTLN